MGKRQKDWARRKREDLLDVLGRKCARCGSKQNLTFDVITPGRDTKHRGMDTSARMSFYRWQFSIGNLQVLCKGCNNAKGDGAPY